MVSVVVHTPFYFDDLARLVRDDRFFAPGCSRLVIVNADPGIVAARAIATDLRLVQIRPGCDRFLNGTFGTGVGAGLVVLG